MLKLGDVDENYYLGRSENAQYERFEWRSKSARFPAQTGKISFLVKAYYGSEENLLDQIYFRSQPSQRPLVGDCRLIVRREKLFEDAFVEVMKHSPEELKKSRLLITFKGEEGLDYGGVSR